MPAKTSKKRGAQIANLLRDEIIRGNIPDGTHLPSEAALMDQFDISRPTLREALRILESQSIITIKRGTRDGAIAHLPDPSIVSYHVALYLRSKRATLRDNHEARALVEPTAIRLLIEAGNSKAAAKELTAIHHETENMVTEEGIQCIGKQVLKFREALIRRTNSPTFKLLNSAVGTIFEAEVGSLSEEFFYEPEAAQFVLDAQKTLITMISQERSNEAITHWRELLRAEMEWISSRIPLDRPFDTLPNT